MTLLPYLALAAAPAQFHGWYELGVVRDAHGAGGAGDACARERSLGESGRYDAPAARQNCGAEQPHVSADPGLGQGGGGVAARCRARVARAVAC